jgi:dihydrofolate reductase
MNSASDSVPRLALVAAVARNGVIGAANALPWRLPEDLRHFRALTTGHAIVMGRRTFESIGRALPGRQNIVVTSRALDAPDVATARSLAEALAQVRMPPPVFCIGGGELYRAALPLADRLHLTEIDRDFDGDTRFPAFDRAQWREVERTSGRSEGPDPLEFAFVAYDRVGRDAQPSAHGATSAPADAH